MKKAIRTLGNYRLYNNDGMLEVFFGTFQKGVRIGFILEEESFASSVYEFELFMNENVYA
jgi:hypothetical protein